MCRLPSRMCGIHMQSSLNLVPDVISRAKKNNHRKTTTKKKQKKTRTGKGTKNGMGGAPLLQGCCILVSKSFSCLFQEVMVWRVCSWYDYWYGFRRCNSKAKARYEAMQKPDREWYGTANPKKGRRNGSQPFQFMLKPWAQRL